MSTNAILQILLYAAVLTALSVPLGRYIALVFHRGKPLRIPVLDSIEKVFYRVCGVDEEEEMSWKTYAFALMLFSFIGLVVLYLLLRLQNILPLNPMGLAAVAPDLALNTATSFVSNTNWQAYGGESTLSYLSQMLGLTVQNFLSAATGLAVLIALIRGLTRKRSDSIGNFWVDLTRGTLYVLLPLSILFALILVSQGVVQSFAPGVTAKLVESTVDANGKAISEQTLPLGPVASQVAIKQLGTNGGGFYNTNSAHPYENPTPFSNFLELLAILLIPAALCHTFGILVKDRRQGWAIFSAMFLVFLALTAPCVYFEEASNPKLSALGIGQAETQDSPSSPSGNLEGKELRFGAAASAIWATATTAASNGSVNSMHDSFTPLGGMFPMLLMQFGEVIFGGVGSGLYGMLAFVLVTVFVAGLMVGRTPEYLGKKIESFEMKMVSLVILIPCALVLVGTALGVYLPSIRASITNPGAHGFSQVLYAYSSMGNNNGSAFAGFGANVPFHNFCGAIVMFVSRFWIILPILALSGSLAKKQPVPVSGGTLPTHTPLFVMLLIGIVLIVGVLTFLPALALGPIVEQLQFGALK